MITLDMLKKCPFNSKVECTSQGTDRCDEKCRDHPDYKEEK